MLIAIGGMQNSQAAETAWLTGEPLKAALAGKMGVTWSNIALREAIERLAASRHVAMMLDRRVDPDQKIELKFDEVPLAEGLQRIGSRLGIGVTMMGPVAYFGPKSTADRLRTVAALRADDARELPAADRTRWMQLKSWKWEAASAPRDLLAESGRSAGVEIEGLDRIPHDLWAAADLPPLSLTDRLTLILSQFDLTFEIVSDRRSIRLVALPENPQIEHNYAVTGSAADVAANLRQQKMLGGAEIQAVGNKLVVRARQEDHDVINDLLSGRSANRTTVTEGKKVYSLRIPVEKPVGKLLDELGPALKVDMHINREAIKSAGLSLDRLVQVDVKDASADELLHAVLDPAGLTFHRRGDVIDILPK